MNPGRLFFDRSCHGNILFLRSGDPVFQDIGGGSVLKREDTSMKRPFFTSPDELFADECYDEQFQEKKRRLTPDQVHLLEKSFEEENKLEPERKILLAKKLGLQPRQVAVWFQNRRARWKTKQLERDYDQLKNMYDALLSDYDSVSKENEKLRAEVVLLIEKLQAKEVAGNPESIQKPDPLATNDDPLALVPRMDVRVEDHLSTGSRGSAVVDEDATHLVDCGDSYLLETDDYPGYIVPVNGVQSEEDGSDNGNSYFTATMLEMAGQQNHVGEEPMGWWVWS